MSHFFHFAYKFYEIFISNFRKVKMSFQALMYGGKISYKNGLRILHKTSFQGNGELRIDESVLLGYPLGGAINSPIIIQPREVKSQIFIGKRSIINNGTEIISRSCILIGNDCLIGARTCILDSDFHGIPADQRHSAGKTEPVTIEDNVWVGSNVIILKGVTIGKDSIVGAGSVVSRSVPAGSIVAGNPIKVIGSVYA